MEQAARRRAFKCFTVFVVETIFPCAEHMLIKCPSDIQVIFSVVRTKWLFHFPFKPKTAQQKSISAKGSAYRGKGRKPPSLSRISCLTAILPLEPALEVALLGLNFFLSQRIVITGSVEVDDVTLAGILKNRTIPTQSPLLDRRELYVAVAPPGQNILGDHVFGPRR